MNATTYLLAHMTELLHTDHDRAGQIMDATFDLLPDALAELDEATVELIRTMTAVIATHVRAIAARAGVPGAANAIIDPEQVDGFDEISLAGACLVVAACNGDQDMVLALALPWRPSARATGAGELLGYLLLQARLAHGQIHSSEVGGA